MAGHQHEEQRVLWEGQGHSPLLWGMGQLTESPDFLFVQFLASFTRRFQLLECINETGKVLSKAKLKGLKWPYAADLSGSPAQC